MKNKKSKIVAPALGLILLSTAASISGSVAWFTASRTAEFKAGNFAVVKTSENLAYTLTAGAGTALANENKDISFDSENFLTHASYDHRNNNILVASPDGSGITNYYGMTAIDSPTAANLKVDDLNGATAKGEVYAAATWKVDFKLTFTSATRKVGLFVDWSKTGMAVPVSFVAGQKVNAGVYYTDALLTDSTKVTFADDYDDGDVDTHLHEITEGEAKTYYIAPAATGKGFRIGLYPIGENAAEHQQAKVIAKNQNTLGSKHLYYNPSDEELDTDDSGDLSPAEILAAYNANMEDGTAYTSNFLLATDSTNKGLPAEGTAKATAAEYASYLGDFPFAANTEVTLSYMCVAWYEGTDENIVNQDAAVKYETIASVLAFEAINLA